MSETKQSALNLVDSFGLTIWINILFIEIHCPQNRNEKVTCPHRNALSTNKEVDEKSPVHKQKITCPHSRMLRPHWKSCTLPFRCCLSLRCTRTCVAKSWRLVFLSICFINKCFVVWSQHNTSTQGKKVNIKECYPSSDPSAQLSRAGQARQEGVCDKKLL